MHTRKVPMQTCKVCRETYNGSDQTSTDLSDQPPESKCIRMNFVRMV